MFPVTRIQFGVLCGIKSKSIGAYVARYVVMGDLIEVQVDSRKLIDLTNRTNYEFLSSRISGNKRHIKVVEEIMKKRICPEPDELKKILSSKSRVQIKKESIVIPKHDEDSVEIPKSNNTSTFDINDVAPTSLKDYKDYYDAKAKKARWEILEIDKSKMLANSIPTDIAVEALSIFASNMQKVYLEMSKRWIIDISHESNLESKITSKMRDEIINIVNSSFKKAVKMSKKSLTQSIEDSKSKVNVKIEEDE